MIDNKKDPRFELTEKQLLVYADYKIQNGNYMITHVEADPGLRGTGAAGRLMEEIVSHARLNAIKLQPYCSCAQIWFARHPEAKDVIS